MEKNLMTERYHRQIILKELGEAGQQKLSAAKVLVIGAGGLGCPVLLYLAAAGIGTLGIIDHDEVTLSNLHRQVLFDMTDIGASKADRAAVKLRQINPDITVTAYTEQLTNRNALTLLNGFDIIVDASDNFPTRYMVNDACVLLSKPLVYGAVSRFEGQVAVWNVGTIDGHRTANYRDLFPVPPEEGAIPNCAEAGVLGVLPGIIGSVQAGEVIKLITHIGNTLANQLQSFNWLNNEWFTCEVTPLKITGTFLPSDVHAFQQREYGFTFNHTSFEEINYSTFNRLLTTSGVSFIDVRESGEQPIVDTFAHLHIPLGQLRGKLDSVKEEIIVFFCQSGKRSKAAARLAAENFSSKKIYSLQYGIAGWKNQNQLQ